MARVGLISLQFCPYSWCIIRYVKDGVEKEIAWDVGSISVPWDWDNDPPSTWVDTANAWMENNKPKLAKVFKFVYDVERTIEDHGIGDVREVFTEHWRIEVDGRIDVEDPA